MTAHDLLLRIHYRASGMWFRCKRTYFRKLLKAPTLEVYFPFYVSAPHRLKIGRNVAIGAYSHLLANESITIGDNTIIASNVQITTSTHSPDIRPYRDYRSDAQVVIGSNVWIGTGVIILPGVHIGDNCIVGAGSLVNRSIPADTLVVGVPARRLRELRPMQA